MEKISKYWTSNPENSEDIYIKEGNKLFKKLVPDKGKSETVHGEILRTISKFIYDLHNNGLGNYDVYLTQFEELISNIEMTNMPMSEKAEMYKKQIAELIKKVKENNQKSRTKTIEEPEEVDCECGNNPDCPDCGGEGWYVDYDNYDDTTEQEEDFEINVVPQLETLRYNIEGLDALMDDVVRFVYKIENKKILKPKVEEKTKKVKQKTNRR